MNSTATVKINPRHLEAGTTPVFGKLPGWVAKLARQAFASNDTRRENEASVRHLLALADAYEKTQPSYADDLRAAAQTHLARSDLGRRID